MHTLIFSFNNEFIQITVSGIFKYTEARRRSKFKKNLDFYLHHLIMNVDTNFIFSNESQCFLL